MNPNEPQSPQPPLGQPEQPQQPQAVVPGSPSNAQPTPQPQQALQPQQPIQPQPSQPQPMAPYGSPKTGNKRMVVIIIVVILAILVIGGVLFLLLGKKSPSTSSNTGSSASSTSSVSATTTSKSACELFNLADAKAIMGASAKTVTSAKPTPAGSITQSMCSYSGSGSISTISIMFDVSSKSAGATAAYAAMQSADSSSKPVSGVGDKASYSPDIQTIAVLKGDVVFTVLVGTGDGSNTQAQATQVSQTILSNF